ncbi:hypothetical protein DL769_008753 [Monosporascus sp. CRB-8-3]|nr:hypothetical protein DL769_008753 [Monosporascus sp. CRB-8-3]
MTTTRPLCRICSVTEGKYKCPRCGAFTEHRDNHPPVEEPVQPQSAAAVSLIQTKESEDAASQDRGEPSTHPAHDVASPSSAGPYSGLADLPEYQMLMKRYPRLPTLLWGIATATDPPTGDDGSNPKQPKFPKFNNGIKKSKEPWTQEKGVQNAVQVLRETRNSPGDDSDAIREFCELVRLFKARKEEEAAAPVFRKKFAKESADAIGELLRNEKSKAL